MQNCNMRLLSIFLVVCPVASKASTVSYWKLDRLPGASPEMGLIDIRDSVGTASLDGGVWESVSFKASKVRPSADCAFPGSPANPTVTLPNGNVGSFFGEGESSYMRRDNLGNSFPLTKSWTLEGWFRPERSGRVTTFGRQPLWGSFQTRGWKCFLAQNGQSWFIEVLAKNETGVIVSAALSGDLSDWCDWRHAALVYDSTDGNGRWDFYLDGILQKSAFNDVRPSGQTCDSRFCLAGDSSTGETFQGLVDCVRLSEGALSPQQFMCAADGTSVSSVLALWPLNADNGAYFDGTDVSGNGWHLLSARETVYRASSSLERPVISNPDATPGFRGSRKKLLGSAAFCSQTGGGGGRVLASSAAMTPSWKH